MTVAEERHFVSVWNPSYADDAMEQHLEVLLSLAKRDDEGKLGDDDIYVWWGKIRSRNRKTVQTHPDEVREIAAELEAEKRGETQLYLTDYRSLYVAHVDEIVLGALPVGEEAHVPGYYARNNHACDFWFRVVDVRRLVSNDLGQVIAQLQPLLNLYYHRKPVSLYGGMVNLPLYVVREDGKRFFDVAERDALIGEAKLWAEFDAEVGDSIAILEKDLRENLFGETAWLALEVTARNFIATGEKLFREHRDDRTFDFGAVLGSFAKALEVQCNVVLHRAVRGLPSAVRYVNIDGRSEDLAAFRALTLGELAHVLNRDTPLGKALAETLINGPWFAGTLPKTLAAFANVRNLSVHSSRVDRAAITHWRSLLLGIGSVGIFVDLSRVQAK